MNKPILTTEKYLLTQAAAVARMTKVGLWGHIVRNDLTARKVGNAIIIRAADLPRFLKEQEGRSR